MAETCKFYKYQKYASYDGGSTWQPLNEYQRGELYEPNSPDCGGGVTYYRWQNLDPSTDYYCSGTTKLYKQKKQYSTDNENWTDVSPAEYQPGMPYEYFSTDCGYIPQSGDPNQYLTFVAQEDGTFSFTNVSSETGMSYSLDSGSTWTTLASREQTPTIHSGETVMWKANKTPLNGSIGYFASTGEFELEGNPMSLLYGDDFRGKIDLTGMNSAFDSLFYRCTGLTSAEKLSLPATTLSKSCYGGMFAFCTSLTVAPALPATTLADNCYDAMFTDCTSLVKAPELPATTLASACYAVMFVGCSSLTTAPALPASATTALCYSYMFQGCSSLIKAPDLPAAQIYDRAYYAMFKGCSSLNSVTCLALVPL